MLTEEIQPYRNLRPQWRLLKCRLSKFAFDFYFFPGVGNYGDSLVFFSGSCSAGVQQLFRLADVKTL